MPLSLNLVAVIALLVANAFFVAAEFALVKARAFRVQTLADEGSSAARLTLRIQANLEAYLAACQLGITMASLGLGWVGEPAVAALLEPLFHLAGVPDTVLHTVSFVTGFLLFSSLHIVVGEQVPKTFAIRKPEPVSVWSAYPLHAAYIAVWPLNWALNKASNALLGLFGVEAAGHGDVYSTEELKGLVASSTEHGEMERERATMVTNLFEFDERLVGRVMIPRNALVEIDVAATPEANLEVLQQGVHSRLPMIDSDNDDDVVGLLLAKDVYADMLKGKETPWADLRHYAREPLLVPETQRIAELFEVMRTSRAHMAFVVDEYGSFVGVVTLEDLLEEIVGEIQDETDDPDSPYEIAETGPGRWEAEGLASLTDVERVVGLPVADNLDANTLSGLFLQRLARMPEPGDEIEESGFRLKVLELDDRHVSRVALERVDAVGSEPSSEDGEG
jgi:CBS domain containing-hemolysin-like protein